MRVPRCLLEAKEVITKRVVDMSLKAYGTVLYLQCVYKLQATVTSRFVASENNTASNTRTRGSYASRDVLFRYYGCVVMGPWLWTQRSSLCFQSH